MGCADGIAAAALLWWWLLVGDTRLCQFHPPGNGCNTFFLVCMAADPAAVQQVDAYSNGSRNACQASCEVIWRHCTHSKHVISQASHVQAAAALLSRPTGQQLAKMSLPSLGITCSLTELRPPDSGHMALKCCNQSSEASRPDADCWMHLAGLELAQLLRTQLVHCWRQLAQHATAYSSKSF